MNNNLAFVFPGQGSQKVGMLSELAAQHPIIQDTFAEASDVLRYDLWALSQQGAQEELNLTEQTQPLLLTASIAIWRVWQSLNGSIPSQLSGHSLGEWSALVCANVVEFSDAVAIVRARGAAMQRAVPSGEGAMAAIIGLDDSAVRAACLVASSDGVVDAVNYNAPGQVVIAGHASAVDTAINACKAAGAKRALALPVSAPFHTSLMKPAADELAAMVSGTSFESPEIPVVHNVHGAAESNAELIKSLMLEQIYKPVLWVDCVLALKAQGAQNLVECGPGKVLSGLTKRIDKEIKCYGLDLPSSMDLTMAALELNTGE
ncbi:MAG: ACP S-malonyltransferase [Porticoccaceae bacterium]|nr:ACP S-malonyltransferase [Porticoccaceae bacterium]MDG1474400.1 ACP S-malonyltransferase [Porticoccaceae bacterium]